MTELESRIEPSTPTPPLSPAVEQGSRFPTEASFLPYLLIAALCVAAPAWLLLAIGGSTSTLPRLQQILWGNWISPLILWLFVTTLLYLLAKRRRLQRERDTSRYLRESVLPAVLSGSAPQDGPEVLYRRLEQGLSEYPTAGPDNLLLDRCRTLLHGSALPVSALEEEVGRYDYAAMQASYSLSRYMIWAIPILGFVGTVWGISSGVAHFADAMASVQNADGIGEALKEHLPLVTGDLATAFDTTFLALLLSLPLMLLLTWTEKHEETYLSDLERRWRQEIAPLLTEATPVLTAPALSGEGEQLRLLTAQIQALQKVMQDLHETVIIRALDNTDQGGSS